MSRDLSCLYIYIILKDHTIPSYTHLLSLSPESSHSKEPPKSQQSRPNSTPSHHVHTCKPAHPNPIRTTPHALTSRRSQHRHHLSIHAYDVSHSTPPLMPSSPYPTAPKQGRQNSQATPTSMTKVLCIRPPRPRPQPHPRLVSLLPQERSRSWCWLGGCVVWCGGGVFLISTHVMQLVYSRCGAWLIRGALRWMDGWLWL